MKRNLRMFAIVAALGVVVALGLAAQQKSADTAVDPVCGMTVVKADAKATFDYKGTTYYFCSTGCKDSFAKDPDKYLAARQEKSPAPMSRMPMGRMQGQAPAAGAPAMAGRSMMGPGGMMRQRMPMMGRMGMMRGGMGRPGRPMMAGGLGRLFMLYGDKMQVSVENTKDGASLKVTSKDPEVVKAIQVHMAEHMAMMKKMEEAAAETPAPGGAAGPAIK
jgi:YHS domain-containing protein